MVYTEKGTVDAFIIQELQKLGWKYIESEEIKKRRRGAFEDALVIDDIKAAIKRLNEIEFTEGDLNFIITTLRTLPQNIDGIDKFLEIIRNGLVVPIQKENKERIIKLIDFKNIENNEFIVTNQYRLEGLKGDRIDILLLINGIPVVLIEAKNPTIEKADWLEAYKQIKRYEEEVRELFKYVQFSIATDGIKTKYFPNAYLEEGSDLISEWKDAYPYKKEDFEGDILKITLYGLLSKENLLKILENYIFVKRDPKKSSKVMARYMQFRASDKICERVIKGLQDKRKKKFGLIWHWQGSGKTYTMAFSAWRLLYAPEAEKPSIFVMVDRKDLEDQIKKDFAFLKIPIERVNSIRELINILKWGKEGKRDIFLVTIEKFRPKEFLILEKQGEKIEIERENVIVLADEVHRTQYGKFAIMMRSIFKNAFIFGFTGTPLSKVERNTFQKFCPEGEFYLDRYSMLEAQEDGFTVPISYTPRLPEYHLNEEQLKELAEFEEKEIKTLSAQEKREFNKKVKPIIKSVLKDKEKIRRIAKDIAEHFKNVVEPTGLKAMIVTVDREACVLFKEAMDELLPRDYSEVVMTPDPNRKIIREYFQKLYERFQIKDDKAILEKIKEKFLHEDFPKILIVTDMLITGFDAPNLWTMYLHKPLKEHRLLQAIARTNRRFSNKKFGQIVDYIGILDELERSYYKFEAEDARDLKIVIRNLETEKEFFKERLNEGLNIFKDIERKDTYESLEAAMGRLIDPDVAAKFEHLIKELMHSYEMLSGEPFLKQYLGDYTWLVKIYVAYNKKFKKADVDELKIEALSRKTKLLTQKAIDMKGIEKSYPTLEINENYMKIIKDKGIKDTGAAIDIISNILNFARANARSEFMVNLKKEVEEVYEELREKKKITEKEIEKIEAFNNRIWDWIKERKEIGEERYPVYEALKLTIPDLDKNRAVRLTNEILNHLENKKLLFHGWSLQRDVRREVKKEIRIKLIAGLKNYKNKIDDLVDKIFYALEGME